MDQSSQLMRTRTPRNPKRKSAMMFTDAINPWTLDPRAQNLPLQHRKHFRNPRVTANGTMSRFQQRSLHLPLRLVLRLLPQCHHLRCLIPLATDITQLHHGCTPMHSKCRIRCPTFRFLDILWQVKLFPKSSQVFPGRIQVDQQEPLKVLGL